MASSGGLQGLGVLIAGAIALGAAAAGCIAWTEDSRGNLQSVGLPGIPVWTATKPSPQTALAPAESLSDELTRDEASGPHWLEELNRWRQACGLQPVADNLQLSDGTRAHAQYLLENARTIGTTVMASASSMGAATHSESPGAPGYSEEGAEAAVGGRHVPGVLQTADVSWNEKNSTADIDGLLIMPFHRVSLLAPWAEVAGYGKAGEYPERVGALALRGRQGRDAGLIVRFPPEGASVPFAAMAAPEWPNPLAACPGYRLPAGLPITLQLPQRPALGSYSVRDVTDNRDLNACGFDAATYSNPDPGQESYARHGLALAKAVVVIPRDPLQAGHRYEVTIDAGGEYRWTFSVTEPAGALAQSP